MSTKHKRRTKYLAFTLVPALLIIMMMLVPALAMAQTACADCHNATTLITGKAIQWAESVHGTGVTYLRGTSAGCAGCHSGGGFSAMVAAGLEPNQVTAGDPNPTRQDCRACHQIHTSYTGIDWALETIAPVNLYAIPGKTFDGGNGNLCAKCHQPRTKPPVAVDGMVTGISSHWGPHHGPQSAMMLGTGGAGAEGTPSGHYTQVADTCVTCHLGSTDNHTFEPSVATCKVCHGGAVTNFDIGGVQTETQAKLDQLGQLLVSAGVLSSIDPEVGAATVTSAPANVAYALYNWIYIAKEDESKGVHNPAYTEYLLDNSIASFPTPAPPAVVTGAIGVKYVSLGGAGGFLGMPTSEEYDVAGGRAQDFVGGKIYWSGGTGAHEMHGEILADYLVIGGPSAFGLPTTDETGVPGYGPGRKSELQYGTIYWSAATGAHEIHGDIRGKWLAMGGPLAFGMPTSDEYAVAGGRAQDFVGGTIYWSAGTGSHEVHGAILAKYLEGGGSGGPDGPLGLPTSDEYSSGAGRRSDFVGGYIYWDAVGGAQVVLN